MSAFSSPEIDVGPDRAAQWLLADEGVQLIDVREPYEHEAGHIEGGRHIELERLASLADTVACDRPVLFYCRLGARSAMAAQAFRAAGHDAYSLAGGLQAWHARGLPLWPADGVVAPH